MSSKRLYEVAREHNLSSDALMALVNRLGYDVHSHMSVASDELLEAIEAEFGKQKEQLKSELALREKKAKERKQRAREAADIEAKKVLEVKLAAERARQEEEARKAKEAAEAAAAAAAAQPRIQPRMQSPDRAPLVARPPIPLVVPTAPRPRPHAIGIAGRPAGAVAPAAARPPGIAPPAAPATVSDPGRKRKKRPQRKRGSRVDQDEVAASFRRTIAQLGTRTKTRRRLRREGGVETEVAEPTRTIEVNEFMSVAELAQKMGVTPTAVVAKCLELGMMATVNQRLDLDTIETIALEFDYSIKVAGEIGEEALEEEAVDESHLVLRPPVVTIMGHVDHGKTSLLDYIRTANVVAGEKGGITQHIGAYGVDIPRGRLTFLDTPGHEAFTAMRARGAQATDIVVLVVAVDDSVMPQTIEAMDHAKAAGVPIIVAINKMDLPGADPERVRSQLSDHGLIPEEWGGKSIMVPVSARTGMGIDHLLEMILLQAEILELKSDPTHRARGVIIEAQLDRGRGPVATVLVQEGTLHAGDYFVTGPYHGRVRNMADVRGKPVTSAGPSTPIQVTGAAGVPQAGDTFVVCAEEQQARDVAQLRERVKRERTFHRIGLTSLATLHDRIKEGALRELKIIIKGDVDGSVEVIADTVAKIKSDEIQVVVIHRGVGAINETDVLLAVASEAIIIGFHVRPDARARELAAREGVDVRLYDIIYEVETDIRLAIEGMLSPIISEERTGEATVKTIFKVSKVGTIAGCEVTEGVARPRDKVRVVRDGVTTYTGQLSNVRRFTDDVKEVAAGLECGIRIENYNDIKVGDVLELFRVVQQERKLAQPVVGPAHPGR